MKRSAFTALCLTTLLLAGGILTVVAKEQASSQATCRQSEAFCLAPQLTDTTARIESVTMPKIATPAWLSAQGAQSQTNGPREIAYAIATKGTVTADVAEFTAQVNQTLNSPEGWSRLGIRFVQVESGAQFTVWLAESSQVPSFSPSGCDAVVSCTVGNNAIINETRWLNGSDSWNAAGGSLRDYRHMVVNHETGHWLGHGHEYCAGAGQPAPVMQQQTIDMQGCVPNPWPQAGELYAPKLGIRS